MPKRRIIHRSKSLSRKVRASSDLGMISADLGRFGQIWANHFSYFEDFDETLAFPAFHNAIAVTSH